MTLEHCIPIYDQIVEIVVFSVTTPHVNQYHYCCKSITRSFINRRGFKSSHCDQHRILETPPS